MSWVPISVRTPDDVSDVFRSWPQYFQTVRDRSLYNVCWCLCNSAWGNQRRCQLPRLYCVSDRWSVGGMRVTGKNLSTEIRSTRRKNCPSVTKLTTNLTWIERSYCDETRVDTAGWHVSLHSSSYSCQADQRKRGMGQVGRGKCVQRGCWWGDLKERKY